MKKSWIVGSVVTAVIAVTAVGLSGGAKSATADQKAAGRIPAGPNEEAIARTRDTVKMLDDVYKQAIVLITDKYVHDEEDFPAGSAAVELFRRVGKTGYHQVRLIDATGEPYEPDNVAKTPFEKQGIKTLKAGKATHEEVVVKDGQAYLRMMTAVPVVMQKCVMCHPHYADAKKGEPIGAISYELPIR